MESFKHNTPALSWREIQRVKVLKARFNSGLSIKVSNRIVNGLNKWFKQMRFIFSPYRRSSGQQLLCGCQSLESGSLPGPHPFIVTRWMHCRHHFLSRLHKIKNWASLSPSMSLIQQRGENPSKDFLPVETPLRVSGQNGVNCLPISELIRRPSQKSNNIHQYLN